jgi:hypothetical protein
MLLYNFEKNADNAKIEMEVLNIIKNCKIEK